MTRAEIINKIKSYELREFANYYIFFEEKEDCKEIRKFKSLYEFYNASYNSIDEVILLTDKKVQIPIFGFLILSQNKEEFFSDESLEFAYKILSQKYWKEDWSPANYEIDLNNLKTFISDAQKANQYIDLNNFNYKVKFKGINQFRSKDTIFFKGYRYDYEINGSKINFVHSRTKENIEIELKHKFEISLEDKKAVVGQILKDDELKSHLDRLNDLLNFSIIKQKSLQVGIIEC